METEQRSDGINKQQEEDEISEVYTPNPDDNEPEALDDSRTKPENDSNEVDEDDNPLHWSASEYITKDKNIVWFIIFGIVVLALIAADIFFLQSYTFSVLIVVMAFSVIIFSSRPPRIIDYTLSSDQGLYVGEKLHHFSEFKAFGLINDQGQHSIMLVPVKRLSLSTSVYFPEEAGEEIVDIFGSRLPMKELKLDAIDIIVRKLRL
ncbi:MAG: hypothetical protein WCK26_01665 [Candidatus Saccharibacteria bacterium]